MGIGADEPSRGSGQVVSRAGRDPRPLTYIAGLAARYPEARIAGANLTQGISGATHFWGAMADGRNLVTPVPLQRWDVDRFYSPDLSSKKMCASFLLGSVQLSCANVQLCSICKIYVIMISLYD